MTTAWNLSGQNFIIAPLWQHPSSQSIIDGLTARGARVFKKDDILQELSTSLTPSRSFEGIILPSTESREENLWLSQLLHCPIYSELDLAQRMIPAKIIAVSGTNGKTSTSEMLAKALQAAGYLTEAFVNFEESVCALKNPQTAYAVVECWSSQLQTCETFAPHLAILLNLEPNHLDHHADFKAYARAKAQIFCRQKSGQILIYNGEDKTLLEIIAAGAPPENRKIAFFPTAKSAAQDEFILAAEGEITAQIAGRERRIPLPDWQDLGVHVFANRLAAVAAALALDLSNEQLGRFLEALAAYQLRPHRQQTVVGNDPILYINDSKSTTPHSALAALARFATHRPLIWITGGTDKNLPLDALVEGGKQADHIVVLGSFPRLEQLFSEHHLPFENKADFAAALEYSRELLHGTGTILFSPIGASDDLFKDYEDRGQQFINAVQTKR